MRTDALPDFLHLFHALGPARRHLPRLLESFDHEPARLRNAGARQLELAGANPAIAAKIGSRQQPMVRRDLGWAEAENNHLLTCYDRAYPELLRQADDYPPLLYASGDIALLASPQIAIVGSRRCTPGGARTAREFAAELVQAKLTVTSGMALGIDAAAHRGALDAGGGTVAVIATGRDIVYPSRNRRLADEIVERGLIVSEFPLGTPARAGHFPRRNRIISGLSLATLVVEAAERSGSLITARLAAEQGRDVFAVPGSIHNPQSRGCHRLLRDGALFAESPADILSELSLLHSFVRDSRIGPSPADKVELDPAQRCLLDAIGYDPVTADTLVQRSGLTIDQVSSMLLLLELNDLIQSAPGGCYVRI